MSWGAVSTGGHIDLILLNLVQQRPVRDLQQFCGPRAVVSRLFERPADQFLLDDPNCFFDT